MSGFMVPDRLRFPIAGGKCCDCGTPVSYETGFTMTGGLGDNSEDRIYCPQHAPNQGKGYTLSDLQQMRAESRDAWDKTIRDREVRLMEQVGPDVYFHVLGPDVPDA